MTQGELIAKVALDKLNELLIHQDDTSREKVANELYEVAKRMESKYGHYDTTEASLATRELSGRELHDILSQAFGFSVEVLVEGEGHIIYDEEGQEFYGRSENMLYDLSTILGIIRYAENKSRVQGYEEHKSELRGLLGI